MSFFLLGSRPKRFVSIAEILMTKKRGPRSLASEERRLRIRIANRTLEIWYESNYSDLLRGYALRAIARLEAERSQNVNTNIGYEPPTNENVDEQGADHDSSEGA